jgi:hypothetical protein
MTTSRVDLAAGTRRELTGRRRPAARPGVRVPAGPAPVRLHIDPDRTGPQARRLPLAAPARVRLRRTATVRPTLAERIFVPGWPVKYLLLAFPVWWVLGLSVLIFPILAVPMAVQLYRMRPIALPPWFALWGLFLAWQVVGLLAITSSPPGTHPGSVSGRLISIAFNWGEYAGVTATLLYVGNLPTDPARGGVAQSTVARWMGWFFLTVLGGGFLGTFAPKLQFRSLTERVLPRSIASNNFVHSLIHPVTAQVQRVIGDADPRPAAPFGYTNSWGNALSILLVWFVAAWVLQSSGWRRWLYATVAAASIVPIIISLNRGLWIGVGVTIAWVLARQLLQGRVGRVLAVAVGTGVALVAVALSPLSTVITDRLNHGVSDNIRAFIAHLSIVAVEHSPVIGYGGNRHATGSSSSIAVGPSASCAACGDVPTGSTGDLWSVLFNQGAVGALFYFGFFVLIIVTFWRARGTYNEAALVTLALVFVYMLFYSALPVAPTLTVIAVGVLWRDRRGHPDEAAVPRAG